MTAPPLLLAFASILAVAAIGVSLFAVWRVQVLVMLADERTHGGLEGCETAIAAIEKTVRSLSAELQELRQLPTSGSASAFPRAGLNLTKRSHVLRMHRLGHPPEKIAAALEVPRQEVELLIKVHRIVVSKL
jgi:hypothetical protein